MSNEQPSSRLDEAIDLAVRRIAAVDPAPGLSGRVRKRLASPSRRPPLYAFRWAAAAAALVVVVLAVMTMPRERGGDAGSPAPVAGRASGEVPRGAEPAPPRSAAAAAEAEAEQRAHRQSVPAERVASLDFAPGGAVTRKADRSDIQAMAMAPPATSSVPSAAAKRSMAADTAAPERRAAATVAATPRPFMATALAADENRAGQAGDGLAQATAGRLEIKPLSVPPLRIDPIAIAPIPDMGRPQ